MSQFVRDKDIEFSLADLEVYQDFTIWQDFKHKGQEMRDSKGNILQFPVRDGALYDKDGKERLFDDIIKMPPFIFKTCFPNLSLNTRYVRKIIITGVEVFYAFPKIVNRRLEALMEDAKRMGQDPLKLVFKQMYHSNNPPMNKYTLEIAGRIDNPPNPESASFKPQVINLTKIEAGVLKELEKLGANITNEQFAKVCNDNNIIDEARIQELWGIYHK